MAVKVLVTGSTGALGGRIVSELASSDFHVMSCARTAGPGVDVLWDLRDDIAFDPALDVDVVVHAAAVKASLDSRGADGSCIANVLGTLRLAEWCVRTGVRHLILISGALVYGEWPTPRKEEDAVKPWLAGDYAMSKWASEQMAQLVTSSGCILTILRMSSLFGVVYRNHLIRRLLSDAAATHQIVVAPPRGDAFDFLHVDDAARTVRKVIERRSAGIWNVGGGAPLTFEGLAELCARPSAATVRLSNGSVGRLPRTLNWVDDARARAVLAHENTVSVESAIADMASAL